MNGEGGESAHNSLSVTKVTELSVSSTAPTLSSSLLERLFPFSQLPLCLWRSHDTVLANQMQAAPPHHLGLLGVTSPRQRERRLSRGRPVQLPFLWELLYGAAEAGHDSKSQGPW